MYDKKEEEELIPSKSLREFQEEYVKIHKEFESEINNINLIESEDFFFQCIDTYYTQLWTNSKKFAGIIQKDYLPLEDRKKKIDFIRFYLKDVPEEEELNKIVDFLEFIDSGDKTKFSCFDDSDNESNILDYDEKDYFIAEIFRLCATKTGRDIICSLYDEINKDSQIKINIFANESDKYAYAISNDKIDYETIKMTHEKFEKMSHDDYKNYIGKETNLKIIGELDKEKPLVLKLRPCGQPVMSFTIGKKDGVPGLLYLPKYLLIGHELTHMLRSLNKIFLVTLAQPEEIKEIYTNPEELGAILVECKILNELGLPERITHAGMNFSILEKNTPNNFYEACLKGSLSCGKISIDAYKEIDDENPQNSDQKKL